MRTRSPGSAADDIVRTRTMRRCRRAKPEICGDAIVSRWPLGNLLSTSATTPISALCNDFARTGPRTASTRSLASAKPSRRGYRRQDAATRLDRREERVQTRQTGTNGQIARARAQAVRLPRAGGAAAMWSRAAVQGLLSAACRHALLQPKAPGVAPARPLNLSRCPCYERDHIPSITR